MQECGDFPTQNLGPASKCDGVGAQELYLECGLLLCHFQKETSYGQFDKQPNKKTRRKIMSQWY